MSMSNNPVTMTTAMLSFAQDAKGDSRRLSLEPREVIGSNDGLHHYYEKENGSIKYGSIVEPGEYAVIDGFPCRVTRIFYSSRGKMGHRKFIYYGLGLVDLFRSPVC